MRRLTAVVLVTAGVLLLTPRGAEAQGFWRWFERMSGPSVQGPGFDVMLACYGVRRLPGNSTEPPPAETPRTSFISPQCADVARHRPWLSAGVSVYRLAGDNDLTGAADDRVDVLGTLPFIDYNFPTGLAASLGVGNRHVSTPAGDFNKPVVEVMAKIKVIRLVDALRGGAAARSVGPSFDRDFIELRLGLVFEGSFDEGDFGPGSRALDASAEPAVIIAFNLLQ